MLVAVWIFASLCFAATSVTEGIEDKHVPISISRTCCDGGPPIPTNEKHVPVSVSRGCAGDQADPFLNSCARITDIVETSDTWATEIDAQCKMTTSDPMTVTVTVTSTTKTTFISTLRRVERQTSFSTTTVTSTVRLTSTVLSISARTQTVQDVFTMPTFVLITRYSYVDKTIVTSTTLQSFVGTFTNQNTITRVTVNRRVISTTTSTTTTRTFPFTTVLLVTAPTITFTDPFVVILTEAPFTSTTTVNLFYTRTITRTDHPSTLTLTTTFLFISVRLVESLVTSFLGTQGVLTTEVFASNPATLFNPTSIETVLIPAP